MTNQIVVVEFVGQEITKFFTLYVPIFCIFHPCNFLRNFSDLHFQRPRYTYYYSDYDIVVDAADPR